MAQLVIRLQCRRPGFDPQVGKIPWRRERLPTPVFWPGESHGLYSARGRRDSDTAERHFMLHLIIPPGTPPLPQPPAHAWHTLLTAPRDLQCVCMPSRVNSATPGTLPSRLLCPRESPGKNAGVGCHFLLQGIFPTRGSNPGLPRCRRILYQLSHKGSPNEAC